MKKRAIPGLLLLLVCTVGFAQNTKRFYKSPYDNRTNGSFNQATTIISLGYGFQNDPVIGYGYGSGVYSAEKTTAGPWYAKVEHGFLRDDFGIGVQAAYSNTSLRYDKTIGNFTDHVSALSVGLMGYYHFSKVIPIPKLDVYAGLGLSAKRLGFSYDSGHADSPADHGETHIYLIGKVGARYYFNSFFGAYIEGGFDHMSDINIGTSIRIGGHHFADGL